jgi:hypothetical protein
MDKIDNAFFQLQYREIMASRWGIIPKELKQGYSQLIQCSAKQHVENAIIL